MVQKMKEDGHQWISEAAVWGRGSRIYGFVRPFCGERGDVHEGWSAP